MSEPRDFGLEATDQDDIVPGPPDKEKGLRRAIQGYLFGLVIATLLTVASFFTLHAHFIWAPAIPVALVVLAIAQMGIHLVFFLHITTAPDNTNNVLALGFGILIVLILLAGSLWIMTNLDQNMLPLGHPMHG